MARAALETVSSWPEELALLRTWAARHLPLVIRLRGSCSPSFWGTPAFAENLDKAAAGQASGRLAGPLAAAVPQALAARQAACNAPDSTGRFKLQRSIMQAAKEELKDGPIFDMLRKRAEQVFNVAAP